MRSRIFILFILFIIQPVIVAQAAVVPLKPIAEREMLVEPVRIREATSTYTEIARMDGSLWACPPAQHAYEEGTPVMLGAEQFRQDCVLLTTVQFKGVVEANAILFAFEIVWKNRPMRCQVASSPVLIHEMSRLSVNTAVNIRQEWLNSSCEMAASPST